ncbi:MULTISPECIES: hypothetical protein [Oscillatoriales]|uniref:Uncharacterized protein n=3 Tax=Limnospira TaxID=2596745 RepID=A0A9P1KG61_9CYAN|nr:MULTISPECIES: hypothetical protein [Oscillatoriales]EKD07502.1 hypothetical protein SPLC1_S411690 [Arthrospira platensis C1]MDC0837451.1 hypothetical protein [Limnoraphis robusta]MDY7053504.1 hypothetical protein [Limnospira fusiformis LS22]EDZ92241.1 hypothetical protein AmaxDRAFT_4980 [Limnospira maxima CS-328]MDT9179721.1 hypothetical protein [Limnospira sp. PMC 1238.20]
MIKTLNKIGKISGQLVAICTAILAVVNYAENTAPKITNQGK